MILIYWVLFGLIVFIGLTLIAMGIYYYVGPKKYKSLNPIDGKLDNGSLEVGTPNDITNNFMKGSAGSLSIFIYMDPTQRTPIYLDPSQKQSINTNEIHGVSTQITAQPNIKTMSITVFHIGSNFSFKQFPGSASGIDTAEIEIMTNSGTTQQVENWVVPPLPKQKWIYITISRVGRRYTLFYNNDIVASFRTINFPVIESNYWTIGDSNSGGYFAFPLVSSRESTKIDVEERLRTFADSKNMPVLPKANITDIFSAFGGCPNGIFCFTPQQDIASVNAWTTPFA